MLLIRCWFIIVPQSAEAEVREMKAKKSVSSPHEDEGEKTASGGEQNWTNTVNHLKVGPHPHLLTQG